MRTASAGEILTVVVVALVVSATAVGMVTVPASVAAAAGTLPISEGFDTDSPTNWSFYGSDDDAGESHTASSNVQVGGNNEPSLLLTDADGNQAGTGLYTSPFDSGNGITAEFRYYSDGGNGADGYTFFLLDESDLSGGFDASDIGDSGGALGYGDSGGGAITGGFLAVGFDEWGNFDEAGYGGGVGGEDEITIRGSTDTTEAPVVASNDLSSNSVDGGWRRAKVTVDPTVGAADEIEVSVYVDFDEDGSYTEVFSPTTYDLATDIDEESGRMPDQLRLGFSASTGGSTNVHAIDDLSVTLPADLTTSVDSQPSNGPYHTGDTVEYTFTVTNNGPNDDGSVTLDPTVTTGASGLENLKWDTDNDGSFDDDTGEQTTISLNSGNAQTVQLQATVGDDASGNLDHDIGAVTGSDVNDPSPNDANASVTVALNAPPSFASSESLADIDEDVGVGSNGGNQIDSNEVFGDEFSDGDGDSFDGVVVTDDAADSSTEGTWQYTTDGGTSWYDVDDGSLSASNGLLLASTHDLRFDPVADYNGDPGDLTVFAVDDSGTTTYTSGSTRQTYDTTADGKSSVVATSGTTLGITVDAVNDAPTADAGSNVTTIDEGEVVGFDATASSDVDGDGLTYNWDVDGDGTDEYLGTAEPDHRYNSPGTYTATLTADDGTETDTDSVTISVSDATAPTADAGDNQTATKGTEVDFDGSNSTDNVGVTSYDWDFDDGATGSGATASHTFDTTGTHEVELTVTDADGNSDTDTLTVDVIATNSGGGGAGGDDDDEEETVIVEPEANAATTATIQNVEDRRTVVISDVKTTRSSDADDGGEQEDGTEPGEETDRRPPNITFDRLTVTVEDVDDGRISVTAREVPDPGPVQQTSDLVPDWQAFTRETGSVAVGEITVDHTVGDEQISTATFRFSVRKGYLSERNVATEDIALFRKESSAWNRLPTDVVGENDTHYRFEADSPGFSRFVVGTARPMFEVTDASIDSNHIVVGDSATVTATVRNLGGVSGSYEGDLLVDGAVVATETIAVTRMSERAVAFDVSPASAGTYHLEIAGQTLELTVRADESMDEFDSPRDSDEQTTSDDGDGLPLGWLLLVVIVGVLASIAVVVVRRRG